MDTIIVYKWDFTGLISPSIPDSFRLADKSSVKTRLEQTRHFPWWLFENSFWIVELLQAEEGDGLKTVWSASASKQESETEFGREAQRG